MTIVVRKVTQVAVGLGNLKRKNKLIPKYTRESTTLNKPRCRVFGAFFGE